MHPIVFLKNSAAKVVFFLLNWTFLNLKKYKKSLKLQKNATKVQFFREKFVSYRIFLLNLHRQRPGFSQKKTQHKH